MAAEHQDPEVAEEPPSPGGGYWYARIPDGMVDQILRNGFIPDKKSTDSSFSSGVRGTKSYRRDRRTNATDGSLIIHRGDLDPHPNNCKTFIHPPYASNQEYRGENDGHYQARVTLAEMGLGAPKCGFCFILYTGVRQQREFWISHWARLQWIDDHPDYAPMEVEEERHWIDEFRDEIESGKVIDYDRVALDITFPKSGKCLVITLILLGRREESSEEEAWWDASSENTGSEKVGLEKAGSERAGSEKADSEKAGSEKAGSEKAGSEKAGSEKAGSDKAGLEECISERSKLEELSDEDTSEASIIFLRTDEDRQKHPGFREPSRTIAQLEFYTRPGSPSPWAAFVPAPHIHPDIFDPHCLSQIQNWIEECVHDHPACVKNAWTTRSADDDGLPRRLLWMKDYREVPPLVRLVTTDSQKSYKYLALSHVWAYTEPYQTIRENYSDHTDRVPWELLSQAFQETVVLALTLGYEYLWVDSLCIIQDDPADKEKELSRMSLIYGQAAVVFAAHGCNLGFEKLSLLVIKDPSHLDDARVYCRPKISHSNLFSASRDPSSWLGRAWCMQELIFAPRVLHFGRWTEELFFECNTLIKCECGALNRDGSERKLTLKKKITEALTRAEKDVEATEQRNELWKVYIMACENYTSRGISLPTDTLPAVSSLMRHFIPYLGAYHAGLWEHNLLLSLQWEAAFTVLSSRHEDYVAPSFSWASRSGGVVWYMDTSKLPTPETHDFATIIDISCDLVGSNPCGRVSGGYMSLRGYTTEMKIESKIPLEPDGRLKMTKECLESFVTLDAKEDLDRLQVGTVVKCLDIMRDKEGYHGNYVSGLVLLPVDGDHDRFCRIGFSTMSCSHFKDCILETVTIV